MSRTVRWNVVTVRQPVFAGPGKASAWVECSCGGSVLIERQHVGHVMTGWRFSCQSCGSTDGAPYPTKRIANDAVHEHFGRFLAQRPDGDRGSEEG